MKKPNESQGPILIFKGMLYLSSLLPRFIWFSNCSFLTDNGLASRIVDTRWGIKCQCIDRSFYALVGHLCFWESKYRVHNLEKELCEFACWHLNLLWFYVSVYYVGPDGWKKLSGDDVGELHYKYYPVVPSSVEHEMAEVAATWEVWLSMGMRSAFLCFPFLTFEGKIGHKLSYNVPEW